MAYRRRARRRLHREHRHRDLMLECRIDRSRHPKAALLYFHLLLPPSTRVTTVDMHEAASEAGLRIDLVCNIYECYVK